MVDRGGGGGVCGGGRSQEQVLWLTSGMRECSRGAVHMGDILWNVLMYFNPIDAAICHNKCSDVGGWRGEGDCGGETVSCYTPACSFPVRLLLVLLSCSKLSSDWFYIKTLSLVTIWTNATEQCRSSNCTSLKCFAFLQKLQALRPLLFWHF